MKTAADWDAADARARDAWVAEHVLQRPVCRYEKAPIGYATLLPDGYCYCTDDDTPTWQLPHFTTDAAADYLVLEHVRAHWTRKMCLAFEEAVETGWCERHLRVWGHVPGEWRWNWTIAYEPGDWSAAAFKALLETAE